VDKETLFDILSECRVSKSEEELKILRFVIKNSSDAHVEVLRKIRSGNTEF
jgi:Xaa-Pro dipeptidase